MKCPKCDSDRIQLDYHDASPLVRFAGVQSLLCNHCGFVFKGFDPFRKIKRVARKQAPNSARRRGTPRYSAHLPTAISLIETASEEGKATYSEPSKGHCETISKNGMSLSLVGSRFPDEELKRSGRLLFVRIHLPSATIEAVVSVIYHDRIGVDQKRKWLLGTRIQQISDADRVKLDEYLLERAEAQPLIVSD